MTLDEAADVNAQAISCGWVRLQASEWNSAGHFGAAWEDHVGRRRCWTPGWVPDHGERWFVHGLGSQSFSGHYAEEHALRGAMLLAEDHLPGGTTAWRYRRTDAQWRQARVAHSIRTHEGEP